jgi:hypothetical protein
MRRRHAGMKGVLSRRALHQWPPPTSTFLLVGRAMAFVDRFCGYGVSCSRLRCLEPESIPLPLVRHIDRRARQRSRIHPVLTILAERDINVRRRGPFSGFAARWMISGAWSRRAMYSGPKAKRRMGRMRRVKRDCPKRTLPPSGSSAKVILKPPLIHSLQPFPSLALSRSRGRIR